MTSKAIIIGGLLFVLSSTLRSQDLGNIATDHLGNRSSEEFTVEIRSK